MQIKFKKLNPKAEVPRYMSEGASGMDVKACLTAHDGVGHCDVLDSSIIRCYLSARQRKAIPTGLSAEIPKGYEIQVRPRSGLALKYGVTVLNTPGTIDSDYRGEIKIILANLGDDTFVIEDGDRIAQLIVVPVVRADIEESVELSETERGSGGFGSTGV